GLTFMFALLYASLFLIVRRGDRILGHQYAEMTRLAKELASAREEAEYANHAKSEFLAMMSHDLRTPLNAIMGFAQMMKARTFGPLGDPHYEDYVKDIQYSGSLLVSLIDDILDLSRIESGKMKLAEEDLDVGYLIRSSVNLITSEAEASQLSLNVDMPPDLPSFRGDEQLVVRILNNLLSNAVKFTPEGGDVTVSVEVLKKGSMMISVADTGIGMSEDDIEKALEPFEQVDSTHSHKHGGTGLGLYLCRKYVEMHGGTQTINSKVGKGTSVSVRFPPERTIRSS
ncbi:MAG: HAMP domain-containing sensor histidine kinase, partial [Rhodospirillales bacterium]